mmetsp:Transcript_47398/g.126877  ORF Transcript_47398/g.126877 Transcript_47398/m.126877 type:complete len:230 (-) Transcript_47398:78-767(-)|eukprot:CAMPEP_0177486848 /NCGR_PEP_ID=MMETSP0369-20130122/29310_1 /TAXON_ID=447022 ORGANISM="Scrippsiella hangoei-like, Strain SHHI-4" /NCGR_SAMPLE_ID=MMETSP0369 /ASSEMBLY_ACC=CAM_ASM_000364 /LENGTH=229 /DNA_ID=CAMNT_0018963115 /DNA_START=90 /DNA_END=779 /DNA_ORIENTATION=+
MVKAVKEKPAGRKVAVPEAPKLSRRALAELVLQRPSSGTSTKALKADLALLKKHLGIPCPHFGKKGVVQLAAPSSEAGAPPKFNKYAGWVEWENAIFLWVNATGGSFDNTFKLDGRQVNWYVGGTNPTDKSPIIKRLLALSDGAAPSAAAQVCLFVRSLATEPYIYCGNCGYLGHDAKKKGFEFTWRLRDFPKLTKAGAFQQLLQSQRPSKATAVRSKAAATAATRWAA